jgi:CRISPR-associated endonuclease/helicase Cas3
MAYCRPTARHACCRLRSPHLNLEDAKLLSTYWGKESRAVPGGPSHHTVLGHCLDVAACAFLLVERHPSLRRALARIAGLDEPATAPTWAFLCALHDVGKFDTRFQRKARRVADILRPSSRGIEERTFDHGSEGFLLLFDEEKDDLGSWLEARLGPSARVAMRAVCGHHGEFPGDVEPSPGTAIRPSLRAEDRRSRKLFLESVLDFAILQGGRLPLTVSHEGVFSQRLAGLCALSDWLGSDTEFFPYHEGPVELDSYWRGAISRAERACTAVGLLRAGANNSSFATLFPGFKPRDVQTLTERLLIDEPALVIIEAQMGKGKTEAALATAGRFLAAGLADGLTVALPTMATSNAMLERVEEVASRMFADDVQLALAHGRASRQPRFLELLRRPVRSADTDATEATVMCARWFAHRKRVLLAQVGVGTVDQALQAALIVKHQFVRMFGLARNVVVIDEVHAYDAYMEVLLERLLGWLGAMGTPVVLLSATLPSARRETLLRAWRGCTDDLAEPSDSFEEARARAYPLVTVGTAHRVTTHTLATELQEERRILRVEVTAHNEAERVAIVAQRLVDAARAGARIVWIRNTVREAQQAFRAVAHADPSVPRNLFHARFRGCDRARVEQDVLRDFGKAGAFGGRVLVATQVVEQSLDLDFDELHTDLAPVDLVLQRAGRLHRHVRARPAGFELPRVVVHIPSREDVDALRFGPSKYVYDSGTLWLTSRALSGRSSLELPTDIRPLVEECYHPASRGVLLAEGGVELVDAERLREGTLVERRVKAKRCCIAPAAMAPEGEPAMDDDDDEYVQAFTRDGRSATILPFWWDGEAARDLDAISKTPAWDLDPNAPAAWSLVERILDQTLTLPARGDVTATAPVGDLAAYQNWLERFRRFAAARGLSKRLVPVPLRREASGHKGTLYAGGRRRRIHYDRTYGLLMPSEQEEREQR